MPTNSQRHISRGDDGPAGRRQFLREMIADPAESLMRGVPPSPVRRTPSRRAFGNRCAGANPTGKKARLRAQPLRGHSKRSSGCRVPSTSARRLLHRPHSLAAVCMPAASEPHQGDQQRHARSHRLGERAMAP